MGASVGSRQASRLRDVDPCEGGKRVESGFHIYSAFSDFPRRLEKVECYRYNGNPSAKHGALRLEMPHSLAFHPYIVPRHPGKKRTILTVGSDAL